MKCSLHIFTLLLLGVLIVPKSVFAQSVAQYVREADVWVLCDGRQGSGTVIHREKGYVLTSGHVAENYHTGEIAPSCDVGFIDPSTNLPKYFLAATVVNAIFSEKNNQDFAVLKLVPSTNPGSPQAPFPSLKTNEFAQKGDPIMITGYSGSGDSQTQRHGTILKFRNGFIDTDAEIVAGDSGGTLTDQAGNLIGLPTRIVTVSNGQGDAEVSFEHVDIRAVIHWLDTINPRGHDEFMTHLDFARYHQNAAFIEQSDLGCFDVVRSVHSSTVYCLMNNGQRLSFPNDRTFLSWFSNFKDVSILNDTDIRDYTLTRNVTLRPGMLVKSASSPKVYVVVDTFGTMRHVTSEQRAIELWGENWASLVTDIPDEFFTNYTIGQPIE